MRLWQASKIAATSSGERISGRVRRLRWYGMRAIVQSGRSRHIRVEEAQGASRLVEGGEADSALLDQVSLVRFHVLGGDGVEGLVDARPSQVPREQSQHEGVGLLGPRTTAVHGQSLGQKPLGLGQLQPGLVHVFLLVADCDLEEAMPGEHPHGRRSRPFSAA